MKWVACALALGLLAPAATPRKKPAARKPAPRLTAEQRAAAQQALEQQVAEARESGILNPAALVPFFELLYRHAKTAPQPLRVLHFGDSHIASDDWPRAVRQKMQERFGDGGPGYTHAGRPFAGYRRWDSKGSATPGFQSAGLLNRNGDGRYGLSGVAVETGRAGQSLQLEAEGAAAEVYYWRQPGGGAFSVGDESGELIRVSTDAEEGPGYVRMVLAQGPHALTLTTLSDAPVRIFGWTLEKQGGVTWETLGINGAQADLLLGWDETLLRDHLRRRDPALIVLGYGTNEARKADWTRESYKAAFAQVLRKLRAAAPLASILVIGPPDHAIRARRKWMGQPGLDRIVAAQREAALEAGCAFWNLRAGMGGRESMPKWVRAGMAQGDYVHFTAAGYHLIGDALYQLMMAQYDVFLSVRRQLMGTAGAAATGIDQ